MKMITSRSAFTLIELMLFLGILAFISSAAIGLLIATEDARVRQRSVSALEQTGAQLLLTMTRTARRAEAVLDPPVGQTGSVLTLQMAATGEFPTIFALSGSGEMLVAQRMNLTSLHGETITVSDLVFRSLESGDARGAAFSFTLSTVIPIPGAPVYSKRFESAVTLDPDDFNTAGGCGSCPAPVCTDGSYTWSYCLYEECTQTTEELSC